mgnify:CR=1 FL=1
MTKSLIGVEIAGVDMHNKWAMLYAPNNNRLEIFHIPEDEVTVIRDLLEDKNEVKLTTQNSTHIQIETFTVLKSTLNYIDDLTHPGMRLTLFLVESRKSKQENFIPLKLISNTI